MIIYILEWNNGELYEDNYTISLGFYSSEEKRQIAKNHYSNCFNKNKDHYGEFQFHEVELDKHLIDI